MPEEREEEGGSTLGLSGLEQHRPSVEGLAPALTDKVRSACTGCAPVKRCGAAILIGAGICACLIQQCTPPAL